MTACNLIAAQCVCKLEAEHEGPHRCACGGSWHYDDNGVFVIAAMPGDDPDPGFVQGQDAGVPPLERLYP